jgi:hypothetical protein
MKIFKSFGEREVVLSQLFVLSGNALIVEIQLPAAVPELAELILNSKLVTFVGTR